MSSPLDILGGASTANPMSALGGLPSNNSSAFSRSSSSGTMANGDIILGGGKTDLNQLFVIGAAVVVGYLLISKLK